LDIKTKTISGLKWSAFSKLLAQLFTWASTLIVIRILTPEEYGLMALATILISFLTLLYEMGLGSAIVQAKKISKDDLKNIFGFVLLINLILCLASIVLAYPIAGFFNEPQLVIFIQVLSVKFILIAFSIIPSSLLLREMNFKSKSLIDLIATISGSIITLTLAIMNFGIWALIAGNIGISIVALCGLFFVKPYFSTPGFSLKRIKRHIYFGGIVTTERILWFLYTQADNIIIGKILGKQTLGLYSVAMDLSSLPMQKLNAIINQVAFSAFAKIQEDKKQLTHAMSNAIRYIGLLSFPIFSGLFITAEEFVPVVLGEKWLEVTLPIMVLSLIMPIRMISNIYPTFLRAIGKPGTSLTNLIISCSIMPISFYLAGINWGLQGVCIAWVSAYPLVFFIETYRTFKASQIPMSLLVRETYKPAFSSTMMVIIVHYEKQFITFPNAILNLSLEIILGATVFIMCLWIINKQLFQDTRQLIKGS